MAKQEIAVFVGSLRRESYSRKLARALAYLAPQGMELAIVEIGHLSLYNQDFDERPPQEWLDLRDRIRSADGVLFVTPEYNRSVPGVLKNAIDIGSRPYGQSAWNGKPGAVASISPGAIGGFGANHHLRQSLVFLNVPTLPQPEVYIGGAAELFDASGNLASTDTETFLRTFMDAYASWVAANAPKKEMALSR